MPGDNFVRLDVTSEDDARDAMASVADKFGKLDILVNAAGVEIEKTIEQTSLDEWNRVFAINATGTFLVSKFALPLLRAAGGGSIINFGSYDGFIADPRLAAYCASKGAVHALTRAMACPRRSRSRRTEEMRPPNQPCPGAGRAT